MHTETQEKNMKTPNLAQSISSFWRNLLQSDCQVAALVYHPTNSMEVPSWCILTSMYCHVFFRMSFGLGGDGTVKWLKHYLNNRYNAKCFSFLTMYISTFQNFLFSSIGQFSIELFSFSSSFLYSRQQPLGRRVAGCIWYIPGGVLFSL